MGDQFPLGPFDRPDSASEPFDTTRPDRDSNGPGDAPPSTNHPAQIAPRDSPDPQGHIDAEPVDSYDPWDDHDHAEAYRRLCNLTASVSNFIRSVRFNIPSDPADCGKTNRRPDLPGFPRDFGASHTLSELKNFSQNMDKFPLIHNELQTHNEHLDPAKFRQYVSDPLCWFCWYPAEMGFVWLRNLLSLLIDRWGWKDYLSLREPPGKFDHTSPEWREYSKDSARLKRGNVPQTIDSATLAALDGALRLLYEGCLWARLSFDAWPCEHDGFGPAMDDILETHPEPHSRSEFAPPRWRAIPDRGGPTFESGHGSKPPGQATPINPAGSGEHELTPAALDWLVSELARRGKTTSAALVVLMADRDSARFDDVARIAHGDEGVGEGAIRANVSRTNRELEALAVPVRFRCRGGMVHKETAGSDPQRGSNGKVTEM